MKSDLFKTLLTPREFLEVKLYEAIGIRYFRKAVLALERLIHRRDKGQNINYHIAMHTSVEVSAFIKYLFYNGAIHVRNLILLVIYFAYKIVFAKEVLLFDYALILLALKDFYCIVLQRYHFLCIKAKQKKIEEHIHRRILRRVAFLRPNARNYDKLYTEADRAFIEKTRKALLDGTDVTITDQEFEALKRFEKLLKTERNDVNGNG